MPQLRTFKKEVRDGRMTWNKTCVQYLIKAYPKNKKVDDVLAKIGKDECFLPEDNDENASNSDETDDDDEDNDGDASEQEALALFHDRSGGCEPVLPTIDNVKAAEEYEICQERIHTYEHIIQSLHGIGNMSMISHMTNEIKKEQRKLRSIGNDDPAILNAMARMRESEAARDRKRRLTLEEDNARLLTASKLRKDIVDANALLKKRNKELKDAESLLEAKHSVKKYSLEDLGKGKKGCGGAKGKGNRWAVLDRLARHSALSAEHKNDFPWFKEAWDARMLEEYKDEWPTVFASWVQKILNDCDLAIPNAFSLFVHNETRRCLDGTTALRVP